MSLKILTTGILIIAGLYAMAQSTVAITGEITAQDGEPLVGATIQLLNTPIATISDANGQYTLSSIEPRVYFVSVTYLGYENKQQQINVASEDINLNFTLTQVPTQLNEIVVTANRRLEDIQKTASAVSAIGSKQIEQLQVEQFTELNSIAPNFRILDDGGTGDATVISSRGIATFDIVPSIGLYVDDVPYFTTFAFPLSLSDLAQIEILRGPQGTLYGRNAMAGVIKITTKAPTNKLSGYASTGLGNLNRQVFSAGINLPLVKDKLFFRGNINYTNRDGFVENTVTGEKLQNRQTLDSNLRLRYNASDRTSINLLYALQDRNSDAYAYAFATPDNDFQDIIRNTPYQVAYDIKPSREATTHNIALNITHYYKKLTLHSTTAFQATDRFRFDELDYTPLDIQSIETSSDYNNFSQEVRLNSSGSGPWQWTSGLFLYRTDNRDINSLRNGVDNPSGTLIQTDRINQIRDGVAVFGHASYKFDQRWKIEGGLRYDYERVFAEIDRIFLPEVMPGRSFEEEAGFTALSPKIALSYRANTSSFVFANLARGYRPGGINGFVADLQDATFNPETTLNYELGIKNNLLNNRLKLNFTGFYTDYIDQQVFTLLDINTISFGTDNIGRTRIFGVELESQWVITKGLSLNVNAGYTNTEIQEYQFSGVDFSTGEEVQIDESGKSLPLAPEFTGNTNLNYILPLTSTINLEASADYVYQSEMYLDVSNFFTQDAYGLLSSRLGITSKHLDLFVWAKNLTDETYFSFAFGQSGFNAGAFGLPRTYGATITGKF